MKKRKKLSSVIAILIGIVMVLVFVGPLAFAGKEGEKEGVTAAGKLPDRYWEVASKYGKPKGKYGTPGEPITLTVGYQPYCTPYWTSTIVKQAELWRKYLPEGSKVIWFRSLSGPLINVNMVAGKNQIGYMAMTPGIRSLDTVPCDMTEMTGYDNGETGGAAVRWELWEKGIVKEPKDMEGRKNGTPFGSYSHRHTLTFQDEFGVEMKNFDMSIELEVTNLKAGNIDVLFSWQPYPMWVEYQKIGKVMWTGASHPSTRKKWYPESYEKWPTSFRVTGCMLMIHDILRDRPDVAVAWHKAEEEAREILNNQKDFAAYLVWTDISEVPPEVIRANLDMMTWDGRITDKVREKLLAMVRQWRAPKSEGGAGILSEPRSKDLDAFVAEACDDSYLRIAIDELKAEGRWTSDLMPGFPTFINPEFDVDKFAGGKGRNASWEDYGEDYEPQFITWEPGKYEY